MNKKVYMFLIIMLFFSCSRKIKIVEMEFVDEILYQENIKEYPLKIISDKTSFEKVFGNKNKSISKVYPKLSLVDFDFGVYDYAFSFGKKLHKLEYGMKLSKEHDFCDYLDKTPVFPVYGEEVKSTLYLYKLKEKNRYRHQCP